MEYFNAREWSGLGASQAQIAYLDSLTTKLNGIEEGAQVNPGDVDIVASYNAVVPIATQAEAEAGTVTDTRRWTPERIEQAIAAKAWPVGSVFTSVVSTNPGTLLGFGTWSAFGAGRVLVGLDSGDTDFDAAEETGGAKTVASAGTNSAPTFTGDPVAAASTDAAPDLVAPDVTGTGVSPVTTATGTVSAPVFSGSATSVVQPYITVYFWKRTA